jgi:two-component system phosphate regulon sensor histidine kinase PhoR
MGGIALVAILCSAGFVATFLFLRSWSRYAQELERLAVADPGKAMRLPPNCPAEFIALAQALKDMAAQVGATLERAVLESSRRETILAGMAEGVLAVDNRLSVVFYNEAFARAFQARLPVAEGRPLYEVVREPALHSTLESVVRTGKSTRDQFQLPAAAGRWFEAHALPFVNGQRPGAIVVLHDVSDIHRQEQTRKDFVANVSHELRTPLAAIRGYAETLLDGALEDQANNRRFVEVILSQSIRLNNIASDLLVLSELDADAPSSPPDRVNLRDVIESAVRTVESSATLRQVSLKNGPCEECVVIGHRFRLEQALVNLLDNAVKFNRPEGEVHIECGKTDDGKVKISVSDTGIGIASEDLKRIFERFYRVDKARSRRVGGTGLGLSIVSQIIERMGGTIRVESQLGRGTTFTIVLDSLR